jgi:hypothetical protein
LAALSKDGIAVLKICLVGFNPLQRISLLSRMIYHPAILIARPFVGPRNQV